MYFTLDENREVIPCGMQQWAEMFSDGKARTVDYTIVHNCMISTVFLGLDHSFSGGRPLVFETYITCPGTEGSVFLRYSTWEHAEEGHKEALISLIELPEW